MVKEKDIILNKFKTIPIWKKALLFSTFLFQFSTFSYAQQIGLEKDWSESHRDNFLSIDKYNLSFGNSYKDSILLTTVDTFNFYYQQYVFDKYYTNFSTESRLEFNTNDSIFINGDTIPLQFYSDFGFLTYNKYNKGYILCFPYINGFSNPLIFDYHLISIDSSGNINWLTYLNLYPLYEGKGINYFQLLGDRTVYILGQHQGTSGTLLDNILSKVDANGNLIFSRRYFINGVQVPWYTTQLSDGSLLMCGRSNSSAMFFKVNPINGDSILMHTSLSIPGANNSRLDVKYLEELSNHTYLSMIYDSTGQGYLCRLDTNFNLLSYYQTNGNFNNFFRVNDNEYIGYQSSSPVKIYAFDSIGTSLWTLPLSTPENVSFVPDGQGGLMGAGNVAYSTGSNQSDYYLVRIDSVGYPAGPICYNPPVIHWAYADIVGANYANLSDSASENLKYSDVLAHNWYFQDGDQAYGQYISHQINAILYPDSFWCMLIVTDGVGCSDTLTINAYTNEVIYPNPDWPPNAIEKRISAPVAGSVELFPNPAQNSVIVQYNYLRGNIELLDNMGRVIQQQQITGKQTVLNLKEHANGFYFVKVSSPGEITVVKKLVVKR